MDIQKIVSPKKKIKPTIYAYITPSNTEKVGWIKIGYTDRDADVRIKEQTHTAGIRAEKLWSHEAKFHNGGEYFSDHDFHNYIKNHEVENQKGTEWFYFNGEPEKAEELFRSFVFKEYASVKSKEGLSYQLRDEQKRAVEMTAKYAKSNPNGEFLWNAKPRFGKTLSAYDLARKLEAKNVLILTNRPAIGYSWLEDFKKFIGWQTEYMFVSESDSMSGSGFLDKDEYKEHLDKNPNSRQIAFASLQDLKGSKHFGGKFEKLHWIAEERWDLLIIDEAHEGVETYKTDKAIEKLTRKFTLHLSGTPFKAIALGRFKEEQIYNWSYEDEQIAKKNWNSESEIENPYESLPQLNMLTYQMSQTITDEVNKGANLDGVEVDYAFDLNEFFSTRDDGTFVYEADVIKWLDTLTTNEKYPFSTEILRSELNHTFWILERVASAKALEKLLKSHPIFQEYKVILAAGDGKTEEDDASNIKSLKKVQDAIKANEKTITLSVGKLTTGVTIPEWTAVMMLSNMKSPSLYMQAAFRAQNPYEWTDNDGVRYQKKNAYVFDFAPERTLVIFDEFANNLNTKTSSGKGASEDRKENIKTLLNFFPIIGEDSNGVMKELDVNDVLTIPKMIKATEVVRRGFMSNLLFANISGIFQAPQSVQAIMNKLHPESQGKQKEIKNIGIEDVQVDDIGNAVVDQNIVINQTKAIFGDKIYEVNKNVFESIKMENEKVSSSKIMKSISEKILPTLNEPIEKIKQQYNLTTHGAKKIEKQILNHVEAVVQEVSTEYSIQSALVSKDFETKLDTAKNEEEKNRILIEKENEEKKMIEEFDELFNKSISDGIVEIGKEIIHNNEQKKENKKKNSNEEEVRSRLRGFARTIPSFIMAYGDNDLTLQNFDAYVPKEVFEEVTGITTEDFLFLRDGGQYEEDGEKKHFSGNLFDETVFNQSVQEFLNKKDELSNYFDDLGEDIFDYIPPQKTNQIFTPKSVVKKMVQTLEDETPGIFDDSTKTFIDLYMKSGLYITEIIKRLYNSTVIKKQYPDDHERIKHILENQVFGFAPSEIIYRISINFIFGELNETIQKKNFIQEDTTPYVKNETLDKLVDKYFE